jgi:hypothetical protein
MANEQQSQSRCCLGILKVNELRHRSLNEMKLANYGPTAEWLNNNHLTSQK